MKLNFEKRILLGITGFRDKDWQEKLQDLDKLHITTISLFLERFDQRQRKEIYRALLETKIKNIPFCHLRNDMEVEELVFLESRYKTKYFSIHEKGFGFIDKWPGFEKRLYLEMNADDYISEKVIVEKIGGFCVDLAHFKIAQSSWTKEFDYTLLKKGKVDFRCNHISGYSSEKNSDIHYAKSLKDFDYLKTLPRFLFGPVMAIEVDNGIEEQIKFKKYLVKLFNSL